MNAEELAELRQDRRVRIADMDTDGERILIALQDGWTLGRNADRFTATTFREAWRILQGAILAPKVGMPATWQIGSDRYGYTVAYVSPSGAKVILSGDRPLANSCPAGDRIEGRLFVSTGEELIVYRRKDGRYRAKGGAGLVTFGVRAQSLDRSF